MSATRRGSTLPARVRTEVIDLDMWPACINACRNKIGHQEYKRLLKRSEATLTKSKYLWLTNPENMTDKARARFEELKSAQRKTGPAWAPQEALREL